MKEIEIIIDKNGECSIELFGYNGKGCSDVSKQLANALGSTTKIDKKADYWKTETKQKQKICRG